MGIVSPRYRRSKILIAKGFQIRFALLLTGVGIIATAIVGIVLYGILVKTQGILIGTDIVTSPDVIDFLVEQRHVYIYSLLLVFVSITLLLMIFGIFISHRLAGPIFAIGRKMQALADGNFQSTLELRKGDEFHDLKDRFNTLVHALQNQVKSELIKINAVIEVLEKMLSTVSSSQKEDLHRCIQDLGTYYSYKKGLIEPSEQKAFQPKRASEDEILL